MSGKQKITVQESPWDMEVLDPNKGDVKSLKFKYVYDFLKDKKGDLLEIGSGHGKILKSLYEYNKDINYFGNELDRDAVIYCKKYLSFTHIYEGDYKDISEDKKYDFIVLYDILEHVDDYLDLLDKSKKLLKPGGYLLVFTICEKGWNIYSLLRLIYPKWSAVTRGHLHYYTKSEILSVFRQKFKIVEIKYLYHLLGSVFDAVVFFATLNNKFKQRFWEGLQNKEKVGIFSKISTICEKIFYQESKILQDISLGGNGMFLILKNE